MALTGKVALVTGGAQGIGRAYCVALFNHGAKVAICDLNVGEGNKLADTLNQKKKGHCIFLVCDVTNDFQFEECFKRTVKEFGQLDIVVNNAGILNDIKTNWKKEVDINLCGVIRGSILALEYLQKGGTIVVTSSIAGIHRDTLYPIYSATKGGVNYFIRSLGAPDSYKHSGIQIVGIAPGLTETPLLQTFTNNIFFPELEDHALKRISKYPIQKPEDVAACLIHVLTENVPSGSIWLVDNGKWRQIMYEKLME